VPRETLSHGRGSANFLQLGFNHEHSHNHLRTQGKLHSVATSSDYWKLTLQPTTYIWIFLFRKPTSPYVPPACCVAPWERGEQHRDPPHCTRRLASWRAARPTNFRIRARWGNCTSCSPARAECPAQSAKNWCCGRKHALRQGKGRLAPDPEALPLITSLSPSVLPPPSHHHLSRPLVTRTKNCLCSNFSHENDFISAKTRCGFHPSIQSLTSRSTLGPGRFRRHPRSSPPSLRLTPSHPASSPRARLFSTIHSFLLRLTPEERFRSPPTASTLAAAPGRLVPYRRHLSEPTCLLSPSPDAGQRVTSTPNCRFASESLPGKNTFS